MPSSPLLETDGPAPARRVTHATPVDEVMADLGTDPRGLAEVAARQRLEQHGPNRLEAPPGRPAWKRFLDQFRNLLVLILLGAAVVAGLVGDLKDTVVITLVLLGNAVLGFLQEGKAQRSLEALRSMLVPVARVRRDGLVGEVPAESLVPGDVVLVEAGDRVPADGRLIAAHGVEIDESSLTGESAPVAKQVAAVAVDAGLGDRTSMAYMGTVVTRGRAELVVTGTGMRTIMGGLAGMLRPDEPRPTPLQDQLHVLGRRLAVVAGVAVTVFAVSGLVMGDDLAETLLSSVALAVAAIPEGLPAVVTVTLALGTQRLARRGAIVKRLASVETLGSTSVICSDKTGTLTLNQMTARAVVVEGRHLDVTGEGYAPAGEVVGADGLADRVRALAVAGALCNDSRIDDGVLVGDPTEGALVALAAKVGVDVDEVRARFPRVAELPFDPASKFMVTVHRDPATGELVGYVKGALDVLLDRSELAPGAEADLIASMEALATQGMRVLAIGEVDVPDDIDAADDPTDVLASAAAPVRLLGLVGIVDPPRTEAGEAIALCRRAGIGVKMITGDHAATAASIAGQLGIVGDVVTGADLDAMGEDELSERVEGIGVFARVAPEHKVRIVEALRARGHVVAMTGDGVNDAPALEAADIGVAMGITGTDVAKEAASMVLTDDDFATIVRAVRSGRAIYDNIVTFVRFQLTTNMGAIISLLGARVAGLPVPFTPIQVLWVNLIMDGPPAMALGVDPPRADTMERPPRDSRAGILSVRRLVRVVAAGAVMALGTLAVLGVGTADGGDEAVALTMAFTTFVFFQVFNALSARVETGTVFSRSTLRNRTLWIALGGVVALQVAAVQVAVVARVFDTVALTATQWAVTVAVASTVLWFEEARKALLRRRMRIQGSGPADGSGDAETDAASDADDVVAAGGRAGLPAVVALVVRRGRRVGVAVAGGALLALGAVMMITPGPGLVVVIAGLAVLATEFAWAEVVLARARERARRSAGAVRGRLRRRADGESTAEAGLASSASRPKGTVGHPAKPDTLPPRRPDLFARVLRRSPAPN